MERPDVLTEHPPETQIPGPIGATWVREPNRGFSFRRREGPWRDALRRRMLALVDATVALLVSASFAFGGGSLDMAFWASVFLPVWILLAKLHGLYDRDQRSLRHLTVDELPTILTWALSGTAALAVLLWLTPAGPPTIGSAVRAWVVAVVAAIVLRAFARALWRQLVPRERALVVGRAPSPMPPAGSSSSFPTSTSTSSSSSTRKPPATDSGLPPSTGSTV